MENGQNYSQNYLYNTNKFLSGYSLVKVAALDITPEQLLTGKGIDPEYKDADMDYEVTRADIKILKQIHSLGDEQYKRLMAYIKALQKLEQMESIVED